MNYTIKVNLSPDLDVNKYNSILAQMKTALGKMGEDISPIDAKKFEVEMSKFKTVANNAFDDFASGADDAKNELDDLGDSIDDAKKKVDGFSKAFQFNQAVEAVKNIAESLGALTGDYVALDNATAKIRTLGGAAKENADKFKELAVQMSADIPINAPALQSATYEALSAGINATAQDIEAFMTGAGKLAVGGGEEVNNTVNLLSSLLNAYGESAQKTAEYSDLLFTTVNLGKTSIPELNASLSQIVPTAAAMGLNLKNVGASLALMTANGIPTAQATTKLNALLVEMQKPGAALSGILNQAGLSVEGLGKKIKSGDFIGALQDLDGAFKKAGVSATQAFSSTESGAAFNTLAKDFAKFQGVVDGFDESAGSTDAAFAEMQGSITGRIDQIKASLSTFFIQVNETFGPGFAVAVGAAQQLTPLITTINGLKQAQEFLTLSKIRETAVNTALNVSQKAVALGQLLQAGATNTLTIAQNALNASMLANPIFLIVAGLAALTGAMYLLYQNVEPVREIFDSTFNAISDIVSTVGSGITAFIDNWILGVQTYFALFSSLVTSAIDVVRNLVNFDFEGAWDALTSSASNAVNAVGDTIESGLEQRNWDKAAESLSAGLSKATDIKLNINSKETLDNFIGEYEKMKSRIDELQSKQKNTKLTESELKELSNLEIQAKKTAGEITKIAPEVKQNMKLAVDESGKLVEQFDVNVQKAKSLTANDTSSANLAAAAKNYSNALIQQSNLIDAQKSKLSELKGQIDKTNDPAVKDRLIEKYNDELAKINQNKEALVKSFVEGGKAGLITENAFDRISKQIGVSNQEARKMVLAEVLKDASKNGKLTDEQIEKIAKSFNHTAKEAKGILKEQEQITEETKQAAEAAKN